MYLWWSLCTLYLHACQVRVTVGHSGLCCCACVMPFLALILCVDSVELREYTREPVYLKHACILLSLQHRYNLFCFRQRSKSRQSEPTSRVEGVGKPVFSLSSFLMGQPLTTLRTWDTARKSRPTSIAGNM